MKKVVVKIGGSLAIDEAKLLDFTRAVAKLSAQDFQAVVRISTRTLRFFPKNRDLSKVCE